MIILIIVGKLLVGMDAEEKFISTLSHSFPP